MKSFVLLAIACTMHAAAQSVSVSPGDQRVHQFAAASIRLSAENVDSIRAYSVTVEYDPTVVRCASVAELGLLSSQYPTFFFSHIDSTKGTIRIDCAILGQGSVSGNGDIAQIIFQGRAIGSSTIDIQNTDFRISGNGSASVTASGGRIGVDVQAAVEEHAGGPETYCLVANYPNPFNPSTSIVVTIPHDQYVTVSVCTLEGRTLEVLMSGFVKQGAYRFRWNGGAYASGVYAAVVKTAYQTKAAKMMLLK